MVCTLIYLRNGIRKCLKLKWNHEVRLAVLLPSFEHLFLQRHFYGKSTDHEKMQSVCVLHQQSKGVCRNHCRNKDKQLNAEQTAANIFVWGIQKIKSLNILCE